MCANLTLDVILPVLALLLTKASKTLLLSGILATQEPEIVSALADAGIADARVEHAGEWILVEVDR